MLNLNENTRVWLKPGITDGRLGVYGLRGLVSQGLGLDVLAGDLFVFANRRKNRVSCLLYPETAIIRTFGTSPPRPFLFCSITLDNSWPIPGYIDSSSSSTSAFGAHLARAGESPDLRQNLLNVSLFIFRFADT
jgi:hypothetical protein